MAIAFVQSAKGTNSATTSVAATWPGNTTTGNAIIVASLTGSVGSVSKITDSQGNAYTKILEFNFGGNGNAGAYWYASNITGGTTPTITITFGSSQTVSLLAFEFSGINIVDAAGTTFVTPSSTTIMNTRPLVIGPSAAPLLIAVAGASTLFGSTTVDAAWSGYVQSDGASFESVGMAYQIVSNTSIGAAYGATFTKTSLAGGGTTVLGFNIMGPTVFNNYQFVKVGDGMSTGEKIR